MFYENALKIINLGLQGKMSYHMLKEFLQGYRYAMPDHNIGGQSTVGMSCIQEDKYRKHLWKFCSVRMNTEILRALIGI